MAGFFVKEAVFPFQKFPGVDARLGPEMRSTGEVMGHASSFGHAFVKSQASAGSPLPEAGTVFLSVNDFDKPVVAKIARDLAKLGFALLATEGTTRWLKGVGIECGTNQQTVGRLAAYHRRHARGRGRSRDQHAPRQPGA